MKIYFLKIGHGDLIHGCGLQDVGTLELPVTGVQHLPEIDNGMELHRIIGHGEMEVVAESAQLEIVAALQVMGSLPDKQGKLKKKLFKFYISNQNVMSNLTVL